MQIARAGSVLKLSGELRIEAAEEVRSALLYLVNTSATPVIDLSEVTVCDLSGLQLLISAKLSAGNMGKALELTRAPDAVQEAEQALGLSLTAGAPACEPQHPFGARAPN